MSAVSSGSRKRWWRRWRAGLIVEIGDWVFREAARQVQQWQRTIHPAFQVSVNKSPVQFRRDAALYQVWLDYFAELGLPPESIVIEIADYAQGYVVAHPMGAAELEAMAANLKAVVLANAGTQFCSDATKLGSRLRGNDGL